MSNVEQLRRELQSLTTRFQSLEVQGSKKPRKKKSKSKGAAAATTTSTMAPLVVSTGKKKRRSKKNGNNVGEGEIVFSRVELLRTLKSVPNQTSSGDWVNIEPDSFPLLKNLSKVFERVQWITLDFFWKPAVGTQYGGLISYGMDWDSLDTVASRARVTSYTPSQTQALWEDNQARPMVIPSSRLMSRQWYLPDSGDLIDRQPGRFVVAADHQSAPSQIILGEVWARYKVKFSGTRPA